MGTIETAVVLVAAGRGSRAAGGPDDLPKQYRRLGGMSVLTRALRAFTKHPAVARVVPVIHAGDHDLYETASRHVSGPLADPVEGGATRQASVRAGLRALGTMSPRNVLIHDAARPFVSSVLIDRVVEALATHDGALPARPVADTLKRGRGGLVQETVERAGLWAAQTPQGFRYDKISAAHDAAQAASREDFTDDAAIAEWHGLEVALVEGAPENTKLTHAEDFDLAERLLRANGHMPGGDWRFGHGYDAHCFAIGDQVMLCGVAVPHERALHGHSDADVGLHALTDALLGAIGDGDIGAHFPPSDPKWRGAASDVFLGDAAERVRALNGRIVNVDVTIICEAPKIGPHRQAMRARIAEILDIDPTRVSVKATTTEGLGFTGRREGIAAEATASVWLP